MTNGLAGRECHRRPVLPCPVMLEETLSFLRVRLPEQEGGIRDQVTTVCSKLQILGDILVGSSFTNRDRSGLARDAQEGGPILLVGKRSNRLSVQDHRNTRLAGDLQRLQVGKERAVAVFGAKDITPAGHDSRSGPDHVGGRHGQAVGGGDQARQ